MIGQFFGPVAYFLARFPVLRILVFSVDLTISEVLKKTPKECRERKNRNLSQSWIKISVEERETIQVSNHQFFEELDASKYIYSHIFNTYLYFRI